VCVCVGVNNIIISPAQNYELMIERNATGT